MKKLAIIRFFFGILVLVLMSACTPTPQIEVSYDPAALSFDGIPAFATESEFVSKFSNRHSGTQQNQLATAWLRDRFTSLGWTCRFDEWEIINYSAPVLLRNLVCQLPGESPREILVVAHHDQAPTTVEGADNDGSGIAILLHLAELFAAESTPKYTLTFVATDAEEYGMLGSRRYAQTHPKTDDIIAGISLDNLGHPYYDGMNMELIGQFRRYGPIWLARTAREAARAAGDLWVPHLRSPLDQITDQAAPISFMDQGPLVAAGIPALGFAGAVPAEFADLHYELWHGPRDTMAFQSPDALHQSGRVAEALIRQLLSMDTFPFESGPYLYFDDSRQVLRGAPLWLIFIGFVGLFILGSFLTGHGRPPEKTRQWLGVVPHFLALWLPLILTILLLYIFAAAGIMEKYHLYPATTKDPDLLNPRWPAIILFLLALGLFLWIGRSIVRRYLGQTTSPEHFRSFAFLIIGLSGIYIIAINPFSILFFVPLLFWFLIRGRRGAGRVFDIVLFALGGLVVYALIFIFGFQVLRYDFTFLWFMMNLLATGTIGFGTALVSTAIIAAGLTMVVTPPQSGHYA